MRQMMKIDELAKEVERQAAVKHDVLTPVSSIYLEGGKYLTIVDEGSYGINDHAHGQIAEYAAIPREYYNRIRTSHPSLLADSVNTLIHARKGESRMIRTLDGTARAVLSDSYRPLDNFDLMKAVLPYLSSRADLSYVSQGITDRRMYLKIISRNLVGEVVKGDVVQSGVLISNSEVRAGAIMVAPFSERLLCTNGATHTDLAFRKAHIGRGIGEIEEAYQFFKDDTRQAADNAFFLKFRDIVEEFLSPATLNKILDGMRAAREDFIEGDSIETVEKMAVVLNLSKPETNGVLTNLLKSDDLSRFGLANAITRTAQDAPDYDRASELEQMGGVMMTAKRLSDYLAPAKRPKKSIRATVVTQRDEVGVFN